MMLLRAKHCHACRAAECAVSLTHPCACKSCCDGHVEHCASHLTCTLQAWCSHRLLQLKAEVEHSSLPAVRDVPECVRPGKRLDVVIVRGPVDHPRSPPLGQRVAGGLAVEAALGERLGCQVASAADGSVCVPCGQLQYSPGSGWAGQWYLISA